MGVKDRSDKADVLTRAYRSGYSGFGIAVVFSFFINLLAFVGPLYMLQIYDRVITSRNEWTLLLLTLLAAFLLIIYALLEKCRSAILVRVGAKFSEVSRRGVFDAVARGTLIKPNGGFGGAVHDLDNIRGFLTGAGFIAFFDAPWVPIFVAACFILHPWYGIVALGGALIIFALALANEFATRKPLGEASREASGANHFLNSSLRNMEVVQAMGMTNQFRQRWESRHNNVLGLQAVASDRAGVLLASTKFVRAFLQVLILGTGAYLSIKQESNPGAMIAASILMGRALAPVEAAVSNWRNFISARTGHARIKELLALVKPLENRVKLPEPKGRLSVEQAFVAPPGGTTDALRAVSFSLLPGESLGVIGPSAAGKSSLARAIVGVWPVRMGAVRIDGAELSHWDPEQLGRYVGYLPQDVELFSGTIAENIARLGEVDDEAVIAAAQLAGAHDMIQKMPQGYNTQIGDGGSQLSGGQRQRIGLARALFNLPSLIVLDEPNSNLDSDGEAALMTALRALHDQKKTVVIVTHKTNILSAVDKILVMTNGQVNAFGPRDEILAKIASANKQRLAAVN